MNREFAHEYVHVNSIGDLAICRETIQKTKKTIKPIYDDQKILGYRIVLITNTIDIEDKLVEPNFEEVTKGKFPFVYAFIQPLENSSIDFDHIMEELNYIRVDPWST